MFWQDSHRSLQTLELCTSNPRNKYSFHIAYLFDCFEQTNIIVIMVLCFSNDAFFDICHHGILKNLHIIYITHMVNCNTEEVKGWNKLLFIMYYLKLNKRAYTQYGDTMHMRFMKGKVATSWSLSVILLSVLQQVHSLFQSKFCAQHDVVLPWCSWMRAS